MHIPGNKVLFWLTIASCFVFILSLLFGFIFFDLIINSLIYMNVRLKEGTVQYERWEELPLAVNYRIYMFNVTNADDVTYNGAIPEVVEVGPYVYKQTRRKQNITYDEEADTWTYLQYMHFEFDTEQSGLLSENDTVVIINVVQNVFFQMATKILPSLTGLLMNEVWRNLFPDTTTLFHTVRVGDILLDGYKFCTPDTLNDELSMVICDLVGLLDLEVLETDSDGSIKFSFVSYKHDKHDGYYTVNAGNKDVSKLGLITEWDGYTYLDTWNGRRSKCNKVTGRDSTIYPPFMDEEPFAIFATELCRSAEIFYVGEDEVMEIEGHKRLLDTDTFSAGTNDENQCFCMDNTRDLYGEKKCLPAGFFDLEACLGAPIIGSFPHFLYGDEEYSNTTKGLTPNQENHQTYVIVEPRTGTPLAGYKRIQFNLLLRPIEGIVITQGVTNAVVPILWAEEGVLITDEYADQFKDQFTSALAIIDIVKWVFIGIGAGMLVIFGGWYFYKLKFSTK